MTVEQPTYMDRIVQDPNILSGKPVVKGTRISVEPILDHLAANPDLDELVAAYPHLTVEDVKSALAYAHEAVVAKGRSAARRGHVQHALYPAAPFNWPDMTTGEVGCLLPLCGSAVSATWL